MKPYTPKQRAAMAAAFKAAQEYQPEQYYLCFALAKAGEGNPSIRTACARAQKEVRRRIWPHITVSLWLKHHGHCVTTSYEEMSLYRARWLASLVAEFSNP